MFGLFSKKKARLLITPEDQEWIESNFRTFIEIFGLERLRANPFLLPDLDTFPYDDFQDPVQFESLLQQLCRQWGVARDEIVVKFFDDIRSKRWEVLPPQGWVNGVGGLYYPSYTSERRSHTIELAKSNLEQPQLLVAVLGHELGHVKLLGEKIIDAGRADMEQMTDLATIYTGFGIVMANTCQNRDGYWIGRAGYLPNEMIAYANALISRITGIDIAVVEPHLNQNTRSLFRESYDYLTQTDDTLLTPNVIERCNSWHQMDRQVSKGFAERDFDAAIQGCKKLLELAPKNQAVYNSLGYAFLLQKNYEAAIPNFTRAVELEPYWDYPYNNRGYCRLQLGDLENAFADLHSSFEMNPDNSFSWRNMGAYYLALGEVAKALPYFEQARTLDPQTELIHFYLGHTHYRMGQAEEARAFFQRSIETGEWNDSLLDAAAVMFKG